MMFDCAPMDVRDGSENKDDRMPFEQLGGGKTKKSMLDSFMVSNVNRVRERLNLPPLAEMHEIEPRLYLGSIRAANDIAMLRKHSVTHVLSVVDDNPPSFPPQFTTRHIQLDDTEDQDLLRFLPVCLPFISSAREVGAILVHGREGHSRSAAIVIGYLIKCGRMSLRIALEQVRSKRREVAPSQSFLRQLEVFELFGGELIHPRTGQSYSDFIRSKQRSQELTHSPQRSIDAFRKGCPSLKADATEVVPLDVGEQESELKDSKSGIMRPPDFLPWTMDPPGVTSLTTSLSSRLSLSPPPSTSSPSSLSISSFGSLPASVSSAAWFQRSNAFNQRPISAPLTPLSVPSSLGMFLDAGFSSSFLPSVPSQNPPLGSVTLLKNLSQLRVQCESSGEVKTPESNRQGGNIQGGIQSMKRKDYSIPQNNNNKNNNRERLRGEKPQLSSPQLNNRSRIGTVPGTVPEISFALESSAEGMDLSDGRYSSGRSQCMNSFPSPRGLDQIGGFKRRKI